MGRQSIVARIVTEDDQPSGLGGGGSSNRGNDPSRPARASGNEKGARGTMAKKERHPPARQQGGSAARLRLKPAALCAALAAVALRWRGERPVLVDNADVLVRGA